MTQRPRSHIIETSSRNALASTLPNSWVIHPSGETHAWAALLKELIKTPPVKEHVGMFSYNLGNALLNNGQWADACVAFDSALINDPSYDNRAYFWGDYGCAKFELDNFDAALRCYEKAVSLEDTPDYRWRLGDIPALAKPPCCAPLIASTKNFPAAHSSAACFDVVPSTLRFRG